MPNLGDAAGRALLCVSRRVLCRFDPVIILRGVVPPSAHTADRQNRWVNWRCPVRYLRITAGLILVAALAGLGVQQKPPPTPFANALESLKKRMAMEGHDQTDQTAFLGGNDGWESIRKVGQT